MALGSARSYNGKALRLLIAGTALIVTAPAFCETHLRQLTVRVYDYSGVPVNVQAAARDGVAAIFHRAGVGLTWVDCPIAAASNTRPAACDIGPVEGLLTLKIVPESMAAGFHLPRDKFGLAVREYGAYVFFDRLRNHIMAKSLPLPPILGIVTAHELGHLLLEKGHSATGLLAEGLLSGQFRDAEKGVWPSFTPDQIAWIQRQPKPALVAGAGSLPLGMN